MGLILELRVCVVARRGPWMALGVSLLAGCGSSGSSTVDDAGMEAAFADATGALDGVVVAEVGSEGSVAAATATFDSSAANDATTASDSSTSDAGEPDGPGAIDAMPADASSTGQPPWTPGADGGCPAPGPPYGGGESAVDGGVAHATVVDVTGAPVAGVFAQICGLDLCAGPQRTDDAGAVTLSASAFTVRKPVLGYGDALRWPLLLVPVPPGPTVNLGTLVTGALPSTGAAFVSGGDAVSGDVTVSLAPGGAAFVDTLLYDTADAQKLRAVAIPVALASAIPSVAGHSLALMYGVTPIDTVFCPAARVAIPNSLGWPAGARVGFYILGDDTAQAWAPYGDWALISLGSVSGDGATVATDDAEGFPLLETFGVRLEP